MLYSTLSYGQEQNKNKYQLVDLCERRLLDVQTISGDSVQGRVIENNLKYELTLSTRHMEQNVTNQQHYFMLQ